METATVSFNQLATTSKHFLPRLASIGENRLQLLTVEMPKVRASLLQACVLALGVAAFGLLPAWRLARARCGWVGSSRRAAPYQQRWRGGWLLEVRNFRSSAGSPVALMPLAWRRARQSRMSCPARRWQSLR